MDYFLLFCKKNKTIKSKTTVTLGARAFSCTVFYFGQVLEKGPARKASGPERHPFDSTKPITTPVIPKHPESGCFADSFLGDIESFKRSYWITITIGA